MKNIKHFVTSVKKVTGNTKEAEDLRKQKSAGAKPRKPAKISLPHRVSQKDSNKDQQGIAELKTRSWYPSIKSSVTFSNNRNATAIKTENFVMKA